MNTAEKYMQRCLDLAELGIGEVTPNPMVGCVIVCNDKIIGEGYHKKYGEAHAEVNAINSVKNPELLSQSTLYVTLEPCAHHGKTPPCSDLIIRMKIPKVVVGTVDPFAEVSGKGIEKMKKAGIDVTVGVLENECRHLNRRFFTFHEKKRPYVIMKWAQTIDGFLDIDRSMEAYGRPTWITNDLSKRLVHRQRSEESAILIGTNTVEKDNPSLTVREWSGKQPLRLVIDQHGRLNKKLNLFSGKVPTLVFTGKDEPSSENLEYVKVDFSKSILWQILENLHSRDILSIIVEGGTELLTSFIDAGLWDEAFIYSGNMFFGKGVKAPSLNAKLVASEKLDNCRLRILVPNS